MNYIFKMFINSLSVVCKRYFFGLKAYQLYVYTTRIYKYVVQKNLLKN